MEFSTSKCQAISITNKIKPIIGKYQVHDHFLEQVNCVKYLGIYIDSKLACNTHVDAIVKKANSTRAFLARNIPRCCRKVKQMAHTTYIRPTVEYASPVWDPHTKRNTNKIEMVQRRSARYVTGNFDRTSSVTSMLNCLSWPTTTLWQERRLGSTIQFSPVNSCPQHTKFSVVIVKRVQLAVEYYLPSIQT